MNLIRNKGWSFTKKINRWLCDKNWHFEWMFIMKIKGHVGWHWMYLVVIFLRKNLRVQNIIRNIKKNVFIFYWIYNEKARCIIWKENVIYFGKAEKKRYGN